MPNAHLSSPPSDRLPPGALLGSIVHAIMVARFPSLAHEQSWDGRQYSVQDTMGARGTVAFDGDRFVGLFFEAASPLNPFRAGAPAYDPRRLLRGLPPSHEPLASRASQYLLQEVAGGAAPVFTAAIWDGDGPVRSAQTWPDAVRGGAHLVARQLKSADAALEDWQEYFDMSAVQLRLARELFDRRSRAGVGDVVLSPAEWSAIVDASGDADGAAASRESFGEIGVRVP